MSHTKNLVNGALLKINKSLETERIKEINNYSISPKSLFINNLKDTINNFIEIFGLHLIRIKNFKNLKDFTYNYSNKNNAISFYNLIFNNPEPFDEFYSMLENNESKKEYDWLCQYRTAYAFLNSADSYKLFTPRITKEMYLQFQKQIPTIKKDYLDGFSIKINSNCFIHTFLIEQYRLPNIIEPSAGDIIFDIGAFEGDTAFWFKKYVMDEGKVYAFEPENHNFKVLEENIKKNNVVNIIPENIALSDKETTFSMSGFGGGSFLSFNGIGKVKVSTIDGFVEKQNILKVDFIKMDIEGAELSTLKGGEKTIKEFKPKLAICVYHKADDLITIPKYIKSLNKNYKFYLRHNSMNFNDTVLYAVDKD